MQSTILVKFRSNTAQSFAEYTIVDDRSNNRSMNRVFLGK